MADILSLNKANFNDDYDKGMAFVENAVESIDLKKRNHIMLAFEEVFTNVLKYNDKDDLSIKIMIEKKDNTVFVTIEDNGEEFNPLLTEEPDITADADERDLGGLGVFLLKQIADSTQYEYRDGMNVLRFGVEV